LKRLNILFSGHERLKHPQPSDIRPGLGVVPPLSKKLANKHGLQVGEVLTIQRRAMLYIGSKHYAFVDNKDFKEWSESLYKTKEFMPGKKIAKADIDKMKLDGCHLEWAIGMVWPDQSYVSLRTYRGPKRNYWSDYHIARLEIFCGKYIYIYILLFINN
jgi:hypothetical protein